MALANKIWKIEIYDSNANLQVFVRSEKDQAILGFQRLENNKLAYQVASLNVGDQLNDKSWNISDSLPFTHSFSVEQISKEARVVYINNEDSVCISSSVPADV